MVRITQSMVLSALNQAYCCAGDLGCKYVHLSECGEYDAAMETMKELNRLNALIFALQGYIAPGTIVTPEILPYLQVAIFNIVGSASTGTLSVDGNPIGTASSVTVLSDFASDLASEVNAGGSGFGSGVDLNNPLPATIVYFDFTINSVSAPSDSATLNIGLDVIGPYSGAATPTDFASGFAAFINSNSNYYAEATGADVRVHAVQDSGGIPINTSIGISTDPGLTISAITTTSSVGYVVTAFAPIGTGSDFNGVSWGFSASNGVIYQLLNTSPFSGGQTASEPTGEDICLSEERAVEIMGAISDICGCNVCGNVDNAQGGVSLFSQVFGSNIIASEIGIILQADV